MTETPQAFCMNFERTKQVVIQIVYAERTECCIVRMVDRHGESQMVVFIKNHGLQMQI